MATRILHINSSGRVQGSLTRQLSALIVDRLKHADFALTTVKRDLSSGLPFIDEQWIGANFTAPEERTKIDEEQLNFSTQLVNEIKQADCIVIGAPIYNFNVPAVLKAWVDLVARVKLTFEYTENGPVGLLKDKKVYLAVSSGGVAIGSEMDFSSRYMKIVLGFIGMTDVTVVDASTITLDEKVVSEKQIDSIIATSSKH